MGNLLAPLPREFYDRDPVAVARDLLGKRLICCGNAGLCGGRIVETEAYLAERDSACHASRGKNRKNATMFGPPGHAYVYVIHARHCLNFVTEPAGRGSAVLLRAIEPLVGIDVMQQRRRTEALLDVARGPARLCEALNIDRRHDGLDLTLGRELWIAEDPETIGMPLSIARSPRIGVTSAHRRLLRFFLAGNRYVSGRKLIARR
ncbi:MAG TPA: DNA-3-methyladenine glycosylase [Pirellulaceae bacterium]|nr:DNA-3-methyladenine glycosylase [Pirellulaceae bacterium]